jgi:hypothetical protein
MHATQDNHATSRKPPAPTEIVAGKLRAPRPSSSTRRFCKGNLWCGPRLKVRDICPQVAATGVLENAPPSGVVEGLAAGLALQPLPDRDLLPIYPRTAIAAGHGADIPIMLSATANEFNFLIPPTTN